MKKVLLLLSVAFVTFSTSCSKDDDNFNPTTEDKSGETMEVYVNAAYSELNGVEVKTNDSTWYYVSAKDGEVIGSGTNSKDAEWAERTDWDIAIQRYKVRTNSGASTSVDAEGGAYKLLPDVSFANAGMSQLGGVDITVDVNTIIGGHGGPGTQSRSALVVAIMEGMPPTWLKAPIYVIRSADGAKYYKVEFTQYKDENDASGHVKFNIAEIY